MTEKMWHLIVGSLCLFSYDFIQPVSTDDLLCSVTQDDRGTVYSVPEFKAEDCGYSWATADHVLANHMEMMEGIVVTNSNRTLVTRNCSNLIYYTRDCISEDSQLTATCMSNCTRNVVAPDDQGILVYVIPISAVAGILVLLGLCFLCWKFRDRICCCNGNIGCYTLVKTVEHPPITPDVEATGQTGTQQMTSPV